MRGIWADGSKNKIDYSAILASACVLAFAAWLSWTEPDYTKIPTSSEWEEMLQRAGKK